MLADRKHGDRLKFRRAGGLKVERGLKKRAKYTRVFDVRTTRDARNYPQS